MEENKKMSAGSKFLVILILLLGAVLVVFKGIKTIRDQNASELSQRFVRNNEVIKQQSGGIFKTSSFKNGKNLVNNWEMTGKVYGKNNNLVVTVYLVCGDGMSDSGSDCSVTGAKYRNNNDPAKEGDDGDWQEIEVGWMEKLLLTFKQ